MHDILVCRTCYMFPLIFLYPMCVYIFSPTDNQAPWVEYVAMGCSTSCVAVCHCTVAVVALLLAHVSWQRVAPYVARTSTRVAPCVEKRNTFSHSCAGTGHSCAAMSHALAPVARQMCAAMSHVWCYSLNYKPIVRCYEPRFGRRCTPNARCSEPRLVQLSGGQLRLFLGRIPPSLSTLLNPGSFGKFSKYIYFWNLQPYMIFSVRSTLSWPNLFLLEDNCACFWAAFQGGLTGVINDTGVLGDVFLCLKT